MTVDHPVPGKPVFFRAGMKNTGHLSGGLGVSRRHGNNPIGAYVTLGDFLNQILDFFGEGLVNRRKNEMISLFISAFFFEILDLIGRYFQFFISPCVGGQPRFTA